MSRSIAPKAAKNEVTLPQPPPPPQEDPTPKDLMKAFLEQRKINKCDLLDLHHAKYDDWLRYFGFNLERELMWYKKDKKFNMTLESSGKNIENKLMSSYKSENGDVAEDSINKPNGVSQIKTVKQNSQKDETCGVVLSTAPKRELTYDMDITNDPIQSQDLMPMVAEGLAYIASMDERLKKADEVALLANEQLQRETSIQNIADVLCGPYKTITWRQDESDCALLKTRAVYRWICANIKVVFPESKPSEGKDRDDGNKVKFTDMSLVNNNVVGKPDTGGGLKKTPTVGNRNRPLTPIGGASCIGTESILLSKEKVKPPSVLTLENRAGNPNDIAELFTEILTAGGGSTTSRTSAGDPVDIVTVKGTLKGTIDKRGRPAGYMQWGWNMVSIPRSTKFQHIGGKKNIDGYKYLIDISLSSTFVGSCAGLLPIIPPSVISKDLPVQQHLTVKEGRERGSRNTSAHERNSQANISPPAGSVTAGLDEAGIYTYLSQILRERTWEATHKNYSAAAPKFMNQCDLSSHFEPFYFACDPRHYVSLHYPDNDQISSLLLSRTISRTVWESYPRLNHLFYKYGLKLDSHRRSTLLVSKASPFYFSLRLDNCANVELVASVLKGTIADQRNVDWNTSSNQIGPGYVYSVREEVTGRQTFTIMTPDIGPYTIVIGARLVNNDRSYCDVSNELFDQVAIFQVKMNFVAINQPILPHQHLTPATLKLVEPSTHKVLLGKQKFVVVPTTPRVLSVAVVNKLFSENTVAVAENMTLQKVSTQVTVHVAESQAVPLMQPSVSTVSSPTGNKKASKQQTNTNSLGIVLPHSPVERTTTDKKITILPLNPATATFEGEVDIDHGVVEIWALIGDVHSISDEIAIPPKKAKPALIPLIKQEVVEKDPRNSIVNESKKTAGKGKQHQQKQEGATGPSYSMMTYTQEHRLSSLLPPVQPIEHTNGSDGKIKGQFVLAISELIVVKQILPKEHGLNDCRGVIQPVLTNNNRLYDDLPFIFRLLSGTTSDGHQEIMDAADNIISRPLIPVGSYFS